VEAAPKSGKVRSVPLADPPAAALDALSRRERYTAPDDLVFCSPTGEYIDSWAMRCRYKAALGRAGLPKLRFHDLRHAFGTMAAQCFPLGDVRAYMGHADISTTMIYAHHVPQRAAAERLTQLVQAAAAPADAVVV
jgi:integrase